MEWGQFTTQRGLESEVNGCISWPWVLSPAGLLCAFLGLSLRLVGCEAVMSGPLPACVYIAKPPPTLPFLLRP